MSKLSIFFDEKENYDISIVYVIQVTKGRRLKQRFLVLAREFYCNRHIFDIIFFSNIKVGDKCSFSPSIEILPATEILANLVVSLCKNQQNMFEAKCIIAMHRND